MFALIDSEWGLIIIVAAALILFGGSKLPKFARSLGTAQSEFKKGLAEGQNALPQSSGTDEAGQASPPRASISEGATVPPVNGSSPTPTAAAANTQSRFCTNCGAQTVPGAKFCASCGKPADTPSSTSLPTE